MSLTDHVPADRLALAGLASFSRQDGPLANAIAAFRITTPGPHWHSDWAWDNYEALAVHLAQSFELPSLLELGGGRDPAFLESGREAGLSVTINDIDAGELAHLPAGTQTARFDLVGDLRGRPDLHEAYDIAVSRMVFEHLPDVPRAWRNVHRLLKPGGVGIAFFPTLYAWPFVINKLLPDEVARGIVERLFPNRSRDGGDPVFPAHYSECFGSERRLRRMLDPIGFREVQVLPFWGHHYLKRFPGLYQAEALMNRAFAALDCRLFTTYALVIVRK
jgi:SAM-dependent methyltransferase